MELWIRSQDKRCLMKVDRVDYDLANGEHRIVVNGFQTLVGKYETEGRTLEIINEIQNSIYYSFVYYPEFSAHLPKPCALYEMPEE